MDLNYDEAIHLDAGSLAEGGLGNAYERVLTALRAYIPTPAPFGEMMDNDTPRYSVGHMGREYLIAAPELDESTGSSWGRATFALFAIVNRELEATPYRFYAINSGNDLFGMLLTPTAAEAARLSLRERRDWPYLPTDEPPLYGHRR
jgi:hypothetical protein